MGLLVIFAFGALLVVVPRLVDRWALYRGASPETLATLAAMTLLGVAAVPVTFATCTGFLAARGHGRDGLSLAAVSGLLLVAIAAGRTLARVLSIRRRWSAFSRLADALALREEPVGVKVLPVGELLAFVSGTQAFVSQGLIEQLAPEQCRAVIEHEREHAAQGHGRLLAAARALTYGVFGLSVARHAEVALDRELDVLADQAASRRIGDPLTVQDTLRAVATATSGEGEIDPTTRARLERLARGENQRPLVDAAIRLVTLALGVLLLASICLSIHTSSIWLGAVACALVVAGFVSFAKPALKPKKPLPSPQEVRHA